MPPAHYRTLSADDCTKYQDIALAVAKVACLASCATQDPDAHTLYSALGATQAPQQPAPGKPGAGLLEAGVILAEAWTASLGRLRRFGAA